MFGIEKLARAITELGINLTKALLLIKVEQKNQNFILTELTGKIARIDKFNRFVHDGSIGDSAPDMDDEEGQQEFIQNKLKEQEAIEEMYLNDISLAPIADEG